MPIRHWLGGRLFRTTVWIVLALALTISGRALAVEPAPTNNREAGPAAMTIEEAMQAMDFGALSGRKLSRGNDFTFTIIDSGFAGLDAWLAEHPEWQDRVTYVSLRDGGARSAIDHGFLVFEVATRIMYEEKLLLIETSDHTSQFGPILNTMYKNGAYLASMSLGARLFAGGGDPSLVYKTLRLLEDYQFTILKSAGNYRKSAHVFDYRDEDGDGYLEFSDAPVDGKLVNTNTVWLSDKTPVSIYLGWNEWGEVTSRFEVSLIGPDGSTVAAKTNTSDTFPGVILSYRAPKPDYYGIAVRDVTEGDHQPPARLGIFAGSAYTGDGLFNGIESLNLFSQYESPFLVSVGAFGLDESGRLAPSLFSSIGHTNSGGIAPQIYGPGQLKLGEKEINGTSLATPFIASLYSYFADYNIRNVMEETGSHRFWTGGLVRDELGRYGIPDAAKIFDNACTRSNLIQNLSHRAGEDALEVSFDFSRSCMQGMTYYLQAYAWGPKMINDFTFSVDQLKTPDGRQDVRGWVELYSEARDITAEPVRIALPYAVLDRAVMGKEIELAFRIGTKAQFDPVAIPGVERYKLTLPEAPPLDNTLKDIDAAAAALRSYRAGGFADALVLAERALASDDVAGENRQTMHFVRSQAALGLGDGAAAYGYYLDDADKGVLAPRSLGAAGLIALGRGETRTAMTHFNTCLEIAGGADAVRCLVGMISANHLLVQKTGEGVTDNYWDAFADVTPDETPAGIMLGRINGTYDAEAFAQQMQTQMRDAFSYGPGLFYMGLFDYLTERPGFGATAFRQSAFQSGSVTFEALAAAEFLKRLEAEGQ